MHKVKQFKVNAKTLSGLGSGTDYRANLPETIPCKELNWGRTPDSNW